jgi:hypothetical protein
MAALLTAATREAGLRILLTLLIASVPLSSLGLSISGSYVALPNLLLATWAFAVLGAVARRSLPFAIDLSRWTIPFLVFVCVASFATLTSPFGSQPWAKGGRQLLGLGIVLVAALGLSNYVWRAQRLEHAVTVLVRVLGFAATIAVVQFLLNNLTSLEVSFEWLDRIGGGDVWRTPGSIGGLQRASGFVTEPAHLGRVLGLGLGVSLIRLGLVGRHHSHRLRETVPAWAALAIVAGQFVSFSLVAWALAMVVAATVIWFSGHRKSGALRVAILGMIVLGAGLVLGPRVWPDLRQKVATLDTLGQETPELVRATDANLSALALAVNRKVMSENLRQRPLIGAGLGSHPLAYARSVGDPGVVEGVRGLNAQDAGSLGLRLLSETGLIGTALFVGGMLWVVLGGLERVRGVGEQESDAVHWKVLGLGLTASTVGIVFADLVRMGVYYDMVLWLSLALTAAVAHRIYSSQASA